MTPRKNLSRNLDQFSVFHEQSRSANPTSYGFVVGHEVNLIGADRASSLLMKKNIGDNPSNNP